MKIQKITSRNRRDFYAIYECEHCGYATNEKSGYDDAFFHSQVIPKMKCKNCGLVASDGYRPLETKYPQGMVV
jgi:rubredoxin